MQEQIIGDDNANGGFGDVETGGFDVDDDSVDGGEMKDIEMTGFRGRGGMKFTTKWLRILLNRLAGMSARMILMWKFNRQTRVEWVLVKVHDHLKRVRSKLKMSLTVEDLLPSLQF